MISIHAPAKGATRSVKGRCCSVPDFNPRSREGSDPVDVGDYVIAHISIHAPAKGATQNALPVLPLLLFQSTLPRRERHYACPECGCSISISIHAPAKGATTKTDKDEFPLNISIHAPAKGATWKRQKCRSPREFQSTLPRRERLISRIWFKRISRFQSTLPRRERRCLRIDTNSFNYFNPRSREGSDTESNAGLQYDRISIHAPAKGATTASVELSDNSIISIHAPAKGATWKRQKCRSPREFQSTLPRRERQGNRQSVNAQR